MVHFSMILIVPIYSRLVMSCLKHTVTINQINASVNHLSWFFIRKTYLFSQKMPFLFILWGYPHKKKHFFLKNFRFFCLQSKSYLLWWINVNKYSVTVITQQSEGFVMDHIDRCIVDILQHNARLPVKEIASRVITGRMRPHRASWKIWCLSWLPGYDKCNCYRLSCKSVHKPWGRTRSKTSLLSLHRILH